MINELNIPEGSVVYVCRRGLDARYVSLMDIDTLKVVKRTPTGYKLDNSGARRGDRLYKDEEYFISTDKAAVATAIKDGVRAELVRLRDTEERLNAKLAEMDGIIYE